MARKAIPAPCGMSLDQPVTMPDLCEVNPGHRGMKPGRLDLNHRMIWKSGAISCLGQTQTALMNRGGHIPVIQKETPTTMIHVVVVVAVVVAVARIVPVRTEWDPTDRVPTDRVPTDRVPTDRVPTDRDPTDRDPTEWDPTDRDPTEWVPTDRVPTDRVPTDRVPTDRVPTMHHVEIRRDLTDQVAAVAVVVMKTRDAETGADLTGADLTGADLTEAAMVVAEGDVVVVDVAMKVRPVVVNRWVGAATIVTAEVVTVAECLEEFEVFNLLRK